jgi:hypothetical protein
MFHSDLFSRNYAPIKFYALICTLRFTLILFIYLQICQASFNSLKELTIHMAETNHFDQYPQAVIENKNATDGIFDGKRKKSLPVRKLLEIERSNASTLMNRKPTEKIPGTKMKFNCDKCGEKYEANQIMGHIRKCDPQIQEMV